MALLICMQGLPRSGKSTIARDLSRQWAAPIVSKDSIRLALHGMPYVALAEPMVRAISRIMVQSLFHVGHEVVIADETHVSRAARDFMKEGPWQTEFYEVTTPMEICVQRAIETEQPWLVDVIPEMAARYEALGDDEVKYDPA